VTLDGTGAVYSYVIVYHSPIPVFAAEIPYVIAQIALDGTDGAVRLTSNVVDYPPDQVKVGTRVEVVWEDATPEISLPKFRPVT